MQALIIGLGSMGKRRIRCLNALGIKQIIGIDPQEKRRNETENLYGIKTYPSIHDTNLANFDFVVISVPPDKHASYMSMCIDAQRNFFVEASVIDEGLAQLDRQAKKAGVVAAPSSTLMFHPAIEKIISIVSSGKIGKLTHFIYHSGQYLPDWHVYEKVEEYYVSNPETGGAREIVPFELTWLVNCFGWPRSVFARVEKTMNIEGAEKIDDTYLLSMNFGGFSGTLLVDVTSRVATRKMMINGTLGQINWDWNFPAINIYDAASGKHFVEEYKISTAANLYNKNIIEQMYIDEMQEFIKCCQDSKHSYINNLSNDAKILNILTTAEASSKHKKELEL